jgi:hypothetical protein
VEIPQLKNLQNFNLIKLKGNVIAAAEPGIYQKHADLKIMPK